jgi:hypothetical protein
MSIRMMHRRRRKLISVRVHVHILEVAVVGNREGLRRLAHHGFDIRNSWLLCLRDYRITLIKAIGIHHTFNLRLSSLWKFPNCLSFHSSLRLEGCTLLRPGFIFEG